MKESKSSRKPISFLQALGLVFLGLKLAGFIDWSWWLVLLPLYAPLAFTALFVFAAFAVGAINAGRNHLDKKQDEVIRMATNSDTGVEN